MPVIAASRPAAASFAPALPSLHQLGEVVLFEPFRLAATVSGQPHLPGVRARVEGVTFVRGQVLYDLAPEDGQGGFHAAFPLCRVSTSFISKHP